MCDRGPLRSLVPPGRRVGFNPPMQPQTSFDLFLSAGHRLLQAVLTRDGLETRPAEARRSVARRLAAGVRLLGAYLRRLLILLALRLEPDVTAPQRPLKRPHGRKMVRKAGFVVFQSECALPDDLFPADRHGPGAGSTAQEQSEVPLSALFAKLDAMAAILADPLPRARRLALHLRRARPGTPLAPGDTAPALRRYGTTLSASYDAMGFAISQASRTRPPPLPPPRRHWRSLTLL
jgi:hypothetical protein